MTIYAKVLVVGMFLLGSSFAFAEDSSKVEITSFSFTASRGRTAELCGKVTGTKSSTTIVRLLVDPKSKAPGAYTAIAGADGKFCTIVATYDGTAEASVPGTQTATASVSSVSGRD